MKKTEWCGEGPLLKDAPVLRREWPLLVNLARSVGDRPSRGTIPDVECWSLFGGFHSHSSRVKLQTHCKLLII